MLGANTYSHTRTSFLLSLLRALEYVWELKRALRAAAHHTLCLFDGTVWWVLMQKHTHNQVQAHKGISPAKPPCAAAQ